jgi:hypothetical protein
MNDEKDWQKVDAEFAKDYGTRLEELTPEPLFEVVQMPAPKVCLRCGRERATSLLYSSLGMRPVLPLCSNCAADWNVAGYHILKDMNAKTLLWELMKFKLRHPFGRPSIFEIRDDLQNLQRWVRKMQRLKQSGG